MRDKIFYLCFLVVIVVVLIWATSFVSQTDTQTTKPADMFSEELEALCQEHDLTDYTISITQILNNQYSADLFVEAPHSLKGEQLLELIEKFKHTKKEYDELTFYTGQLFINGDGYNTQNQTVYKNGKQIYPEPTPEPTPTPRPSGGFKPWPSNDKDPYDAGDYSHPDDFYYDYPDDFYDFEEAEDYYDMYG